MHPRQAAVRGHFADLLAGAFARRQFRRQFGNDVTQAMDLRLALDMGDGAAGILKVFLPVHHLQDQIGSGPFGFQTWTARTSELRRGLSSKTASTGVFERMPPSQKSSPSMRTAGNAGGRRGEART